MSVKILRHHARAITGVAALFTFGLALPVTAVEDADFQFNTTQDLAALCSVAPGTPEYPMSHQACRAFIEATLQYHDAVSKPNKLKRLVCYPPNTTIDDGVTAFNAWAKDHAGDIKSLAEPPVLGLIRALAAKYPCKD
jgi:hypothetical protein